MPKVLLTIGTLKCVTVRDPETGKEKIVSTRGKWLAWEPARKKFHICTVRGRASGKVPTAIAKAHSRFHGTPPQGRLLSAESPTPSGTLAPLGLAVDLVYEVPQTVRSPGKNPYQWHHAFGDTGHKGGKSYSTAVMPWLARDSKGNLFFVRRKGNIFNVDSWLRG